MSETFYIKKTAFDDNNFDLTQRETDSFIIGPGELNGPGGLAQDSDLELYGFGAIKWGEGVNQNQYRMLENFACPQKETGDYWAAGSPPESGYDSNIHPIAPKDENDLGLGNGITAPLIGQGWYNATVSHSYEFKVSGWVEIISNDGVVLNDNLDMNGSIVVNSGAVTTGSDDATLTTKQFVDTVLTTHATDETLHVTANQNTFLDGLNLPTLDSSEVNYLEGASSNIQAQIDALNISVDAAISTALDALHPIGSVYYTENSTMPTILTDIGTWVQTARGRTIIGEGTADGGTYTQGDTGGVKNAVNVLHNHVTDTDGGHSHTTSNIPHAGGIQCCSVDITSSSQSGGYDSRATTTNGAHSHTVSTAGVPGLDKNLPPYLVTYIFVRTA